MISVIVPIFNIEKSIRMCLESLKKQSLKDIEFILVDDGSTDSSGEIADEYATESRFRVFHTTNNGLSAARNYGIKKSKGEWIMFVDGDDYVSTDFCRIPYSAAIDNKADLVIFRFFSVEKGKILETPKEKGSIRVSVIDEMSVYKNGDIAAWNKLYKRDLFTNNLYPEGRVYEDVVTTYKIVHSASRIIYVYNELYYHIVDRKESITHSHSIKNQIDYFLMIKEQYDLLTSYGYPKEDISYMEYEYAIGILARTPPSDNMHYLDAKNILESCNKIPKLISLKQKIAFCTWKMNKKLFYNLSRLSGRMQ